MIKNWWIMGKNGLKWYGAFNFIKYFVNLFVLIYKKSKSFIKSTRQDEIINKNFKQNKAKIIKQKIKYNKFGFPTYRDINKD